MTVNVAKVTEEAKQITAKFSSTLKKINMKEKGFKGQIGGFREEGNGLEGDKDFRKRMFANAPSKDGDCLIMEKKKW